MGAGRFFFLDYWDILRAHRLVNLRFRTGMPQFRGQELTCIRGERVVFAGLGFTLDAGGALLLKGPNGSGKSSLLRLMAGLLRPASGALAWDGEAIWSDPDGHCRRLHYVGHLDAVKPAFTVAENLAFWFGLQAGGSSASAVEAALEAFAIAHLADLPGRYLSAGQKRRLNLARIVAAPAPLWLLDEPATGLDEDAVARLEEAIARHRAGGGMAAVSTHAGLDVETAEVVELGNFPAKDGFAAAGEWEP
jgi:heme exporter protein A